MMRTRKLAVLIVMMVIALTVSACGSTNAMFGTAGKAESNMEPTVTLEELWGLLGKTDAETADLFGGGAENWTEDKKYYIGRNFEIELYEERYAMHTCCNEEKIVNAVSVWLSEEGNRVTKEELNLWVERITEATGVTPDYHESSESGSKNWKWVFDDTIVTMHHLGDLLSINMNVAVGELK